MSTFELSGMCVRTCAHMRGRCHRRTFVMFTILAPYIILLKTCGQIFIHRVMKLFFHLILILQATST